jgi:hypothetical protein
MWPVEAPCRQKGQAPRLVATLRYPPHNLALFIYGAVFAKYGHACLFRKQVQLDRLVTTLKNTEPHYIRCIKPNAAKAARTFDGDMVGAQLRYAGSFLGVCCCCCCCCCCVCSMLTPPFWYTGMMETIRIRQVGFPLRYTFESFFKRYNCLANNSKCQASQWR